MRSSKLITLLRNFVGVGNTFAFFCTDFLIAGIPFSSDKNKMYERKLSTIVKDHTADEENCHIPVKMAGAFNVKIMKQR